MKKLLLILLLAFAYNTQAQTTYTFTGAVDSDWFDAANWDANGIPSNSSSNADTIIINSSTSVFNNPLLRPNTHLILNQNFSVNSTFGAFFRFELITLVNTQLSILTSNPSLDSIAITEIEGDGILSYFDDVNFSELNLNGLKVNPGTVTTSGTIQLSVNTDFSDSIFIIDAFDGPSTNNYDRIVFGDFQSRIVNVQLEVNANGYSPLNNDVFTPFTKTGGFSQSDNLNMGANVVTNLQALGYTVVPNLSGTSGTVTIKDIEAPSIINCPSNTTETADCGTYFGVPDYTTGLTATDNDPGAITYSQTPLPSSGALDGTVVTLTATDASGNSSSCDFTLSVTEETLTTQQAGDIVSRNITVYPNPSKGVFSLKNTSGLLLETGQVIDTKGALVKTVDLSSYNPNKTIDLSDLSAGIYLFKILTVDGFVTKKISIE